MSAKKVSDQTRRLIRDEIEQSERTRDVPLSGKAARRGSAVVYSVRLPPERVEQIEAVARTLDVPASSLVRGWVLAGLAEHDSGTVTGTIDRLEADVHRLRELIS